MYPFKSTLLISVFVVSFTYLNTPSTSTVSKSNSINTSRTILFNSVYHTFSNLQKKDLFKVSVSGKTIFSGQVVFEIFDFKTKIIFKETFPALDLLGDKEDVLTTKKQKEDEIKRRFKSFFASKNFLIPAIGTYEKFYADNADQAIWNDIRSDHSAIGFNYEHGYEGTYRIAYSKSKKAVVRYFYSD